MDEVILFVSKAQRERARLIREARAIYDSIFPADVPAGKRQDEITSGQTLNVTNSSREGAVP